MRDRRSVGSHALSRRVRAARGHRARGSGYAHQAVAAVKADQAVALAMFQKGEGGFKDRDLYPFVSEPRTGRHLSVRPLFQPAPTLKP